MGRTVYLPTISRLIFTVNYIVGKYTSPVGGMGCAFHVFQKKELQVSCCRLRFGKGYCIY